MHGDDCRGAHAATQASPLAGEGDSRRLARRGEGWCGGHDPSPGPRQAPRLSTSPARGEVGAREEVETQMAAGVATGRHCVAALCGVAVGLTPSGFLPVLRHFQRRSPELPGFRPQCHRRYAGNRVRVVAGLSALGFHLLTVTLAASYRGPCFPRPLPNLACTTPANLWVPHNLPTFLTFPPVPVFRLPIKALTSHRVGEVKSTPASLWITGISGISPPFALLHRDDKLHRHATPAA